MGIDEYENIKIRGVSGAYYRLDYGALVKNKLIGIIRIGKIYKKADGVKIWCIMEGLSLEFPPEEKEIYLLGTKKDWEGVWKSVAEFFSSPYKSPTEITQLEIEEIKKEETEKAKINGIYIVEVEKEEINDKYNELKSSLHSQLESYLY